MLGFFYLGDRETLNSMAPYAHFSQALCAVDELKAAQEAILAAAKQDIDSGEHVRDVQR